MNRKILIAGRLFTFAVAFSFFTTISLGQSVFNLSNYTIPFVPGDRALTFSLAIGTVNPGDIEVWVFYDKSPTELATLSSSSFSQVNHYGKPVMIKRNANLECTFVFPHPNHFNYPNGDLFVVKANNNTQGLIRANYPVLNVSIAGLYDVHPGIDFNPIGFTKGECVFFRVYKRTRTASGYTDEVSDIKTFTMPDSFNIGIAGDSYGSGEGAPNDGAPMWSDCSCHRSNKSGLLRGVKQFIANHPEVAVDYSFKACSGATTFDFYQTMQATDFCGKVAKEVQFQQIKNDLLVNRIHDAVHMLIFSAGGNNAGFGDLVKKYLVLPLNLSQLNSYGQLVNADLLKTYETKINRLPDDYADLNRGIQNFFSTVSGIKPIVGITTYPDLTNGPTGRCGCTHPGYPLYYCAPYETDFGISPQPEYDLIRTSFLLPINRKIRATTSLNWNVIDIESAAGTNGICNCTNPYFNTIAASFSTQSDIYGVVHPNENGYNNLYREKIYRFVKDKYSEFKDSYVLAAAVGAVKPPQHNCSTQQAAQITVMTTLISELEQRPRNFSNYRGFENLLSDLRNSLNSSTSLQTVSTTNQMLKKNVLQTNTYQAAVSALPMIETIVKKSYPALSLTPVDEQLFAENAQLRSDLNNYLQSNELQSKLQEVKKAEKKIRRTNDPLDRLYNNQ